MERGGGTLGPQINEPEVVVGERTIVIIQPVIGEQMWCGVEGLNCRVAGDPKGEMPVLDVEQRRIFLGIISSV